MCICVSNACPRGTESRTRVCTDLRFITQTRPLAAPDKVYMGVLGILDARGPVVLNLQKCFARAAISRFQIRRCERVRRVQNCSKTGSKVLFAVFTSLLILFFYFSAYIDYRIHPCIHRLPRTTRPMDPACCPYCPAFLEVFPHCNLKLTDFYQPSQPRTPGGVVDVRGRSDFSRFDPRPERPHFSNFSPPTEQRPGSEGGAGGEGGGLRCAKST